MEFKEGQVYKRYEDPLNDNKWIKFKVLKNNGRAISLKITDHSKDYSYIGDNGTNWTFYKNSFFFEKSLIVCEVQSEEDAKFLNEIFIDLALQTNDEEWFYELTKEAAYEKR